VFSAMRMTSFSVFFTFFAFVMLFGCRKKEGLSIEEDTGCDQTTDSAEENVSGGTSFIETEETVCLEEHLAIEVVPTKMMILLDRSRSMDNPISIDDENGTAWSMATSAIAELVIAQEDVIDFGLDLFPADSGEMLCRTNTDVLVDAVPQNAEQIIAELDSIIRGGTPPLLRALSNYRETQFAPSFFDGQAVRVLVVMVGGRDTCGKAGDTDSDDPLTEALAEVASTLLIDRNITAIVIGVGDSIDSEQLNAIASAGSAYETYIDLQSEHDLVDLLAAIKSTSISCTMGLTPYDNTLVDFDRTIVSLDGERISFNDTCTNGEGWRWEDDAKEGIVFCEVTCHLISETVEEIVVLAPCLD
jgi:hypothetical protein